MKKRGRSRSRVNWTGTSTCPVTSAFGIQPRGCCTPNMRQTGKFVPFRWPAPNCRSRWSRLTNDCNSGSSPRSRKRLMATSPTSCVRCGRSQLRCLPGRRTRNSMKMIRTYYVGQRSAPPADNALARKWAAPIVATRTRATGPGLPFFLTARDSDIRLEMRGRFRLHVSLAMPWPSSFSAPTATA